MLGMFEATGASIVAMQGMQAFDDHKHYSRDSTGCPSDESSVKSCEVWGGSFHVIYAKIPAECEGKCYISWGTPGAIC